MLFAAPQLKDALDSASNGGAKPFVVYPSPQGVLISQELIETLSRQEHVVILCGHYEGIDERFARRYVDLEVSVGDCVLTGGEIPAMMIADAMARLVPGVVGKHKAVIEDSFYRGMLDNPNYTRPALWEGEAVPEVLLSGNAGEISRWRRKTAAARTISRRPDLLSRASIREYITGGVRATFVLNRGQAEFSGVLELCRAYDLGRPYVIAHSHELRERAKQIFPQAKIMAGMRELAGQDDLTVRVFTEARTSSMHSLEVKRRCLEHDGRVIFVFAEDEAELEGLDGIAGYLYEQRMDIPLNMRAGIALDKFLGKR
jgi:tRNA (guanine37-N1)-methyltransferase